MLRKKKTHNKEEEKEGEDISSAVGGISNTANRKAAMDNLIRDTGLAGV